MNVLGLVVEYNPFHLGHLHHLTEAKRLAAPEATVAVMSGCFTQRGEPAVTDKWARAEMALRHGVDLVLELPFAWAVRSAPYFASGATRLLAAIGATDICFGSESGSLAPLQQAAEVLLAEPDEFKQVLQTELSKGRSFAAAQDQALRAVASELPPGVFASPNNTLGIHYLLAIRQYELPLKAHTITRTSAYDSADAAVNMPSAKAIRAQLARGESATGLPSDAADLLQQAIAVGRAPISWDQFALPLLYSLRQLSSEELSSFPEAGEGLGLRLWQAARQTNNLAELIALVKTRRFTLTRLQRLLCYVLLNCRKRDLEEITDELAPPYARVLAMNTANSTIRQMLKDTPLPVVYAAGTAGFAEQRAKRCLDLDIAATDCYSLAFLQSGLSGLDFTTPVITVTAGTI